MFNNRFLLVLGLLSLLLVAMAVSRPLAKVPTSVDLSLPHRPVIAARGYYFAIQRGREADSARLTALADYYQKLEGAHSIQRSREADSARWATMSEYYQNIEEAQNIQRGRAADALRWTAIAKHYK